MNIEIEKYNAMQTKTDQEICHLLATSIDNGLAGANSKIWHRHPVWFIEGNPIVGYSKLKDCVRLLFWSGQSFEEKILRNEGSFKAAEVRYTSIDQVNQTDLMRWIKKGKEIQWDYKNIVKKRGKLDRIS